MRRKKILLDMDGTIADLYGQKKWLEKLQKEDKNIFLKCKPLIKESHLLFIFNPRYYEIVICSMTPKDCTEKYHENVIEQKNKWLDKYFPSIKKRIFLKYGYDKNIKGYEGAVLIDDNDLIRENFEGWSFNPKDLWDL